MPSNLLITHNDLDGISCAILAIKYKLVDRIYCWNNGFFDDLDFNEFDHIYITDLSIDACYLQSYFENEDGPTITVLDHHRTSLYLKYYPPSICDIERCGTRLVYEKLVHDESDTVNNFVNLVDLYDRWVEEDVMFEDACNLQRLFEHYVDLTKLKYIDSILLYDKSTIQPTIFKQFIERMLGRLTMKDFIFTPSDNTYIRQELMAEDELYKSVLKNIKFRTDSRGNRFALYENVGKISIIANRVLKEHNDLIYVLIIFPLNNRISIRSIPAFDVLQLKGFHGHKNAAGGEFKHSFMSYLRLNNHASMKYIKDE